MLSSFYSWDLCHCNVTSLHPIPPPPRARVQQCSPFTRPKTHPPTVRLPLCYVSPSACRMSIRVLSTDLCRFSVCSVSYWSSLLSFLCRCCLILVFSSLSFDVRRFVHAGLVRLTEDSVWAFSGLGVWVSDGLGYGSDLWIVCVWCGRNTSHSQKRTWSVWWVWPQVGGWCIGNVNSRLKEEQW
jgi:hypothetical protein